MLQDLRYAIRNLRAKPIVLCAAILSLALGIGANTAVFTFTNALLLNPLPVKSPDQLTLLATENSAHYGNVHGYARYSYSYPMYQDVRDGNSVFAGVACRGSAALNLTHAGRAERILAELVSGNYFDVLGVAPAVGRLLTPADDRLAGGHPVAVLSHGFWVRRFGADPDIIDRDIVLNGRNIRVVGVARRGFEGFEIGSPREVFLPVAMTGAFIPATDRLNERKTLWLQVIARRRDGISPEQAQAASAVHFRQLLEKDWASAESGSNAEMRQRYFRQTLQLEPGGRGFGRLRNMSERPLRVLTGVVAILLLIACANVANLLLAQAASRHREIAVRMALGATRLRILRQLLTESVLLSLAGAVAGLALAHWGVDMLAAMFPANMPAPESATPDARVLAFTTLLAVLTGVLFGIAPAWRATKAQIAPELKGVRSTSIEFGGKSVLGGALVVAQVAACVLLTAGAAVFLRSLHNMRALDVGFSKQHLLLMTLDPSLAGHNPTRTLELLESLTERARSIPGVRAAALGRVPLLSGMDFTGPANVEGYTNPDVGTRRVALNWVGDGYFEALGIELVKGRAISARDSAAGAKVCVIDEKAARQFFGDTDPIGRKLALGLLNPPDTEIAGVVRSAKASSITAEAPRTVYFALSQSKPREAILHVRTSGDPEPVAALVRQELKNLDPNVPLYNVRTLETQIDDTLIGQRLVAAMTTCFGLIAAMLAALGVYGVLSYRVARRTREIGIQIALGARPALILRGVLRQAALLMGTGIAIGATGALLLAGVVSAFVFGVPENDGTILALCCAGVALIGLGASAVPALRAARVSPLDAMRQDG